MILFLGWFERNYDWKVTTHVCRFYGNMHFAEDFLLLSIRRGMTYNYIINEGISIVSNIPNRHPFIGVHVFSFLLSFSQSANEIWSALDSKCTRGIMGWKFLSNARKRCLFFMSEGKEKWHKGKKSLNSRAFCKQKILFRFTESVFWLSCNSRIYRS